MKLVILKENLLKACQLVQKFVVSRGQMPVLEHMLIEAGKEGVFFVVNNLDTGVRLRVSGKVEEGGSVLVRVKLLTDLVNHLPMGSIGLEVVDGQLVINGGKNTVKLQTLPVEEFPELFEALTPLAELDVAGVLRDLGYVSYAVSGDDSRPVLTGCFWDAGAGKLVATDGYRLSMVENKKVWGMANIKQGMIVPGKNFVQAMSLFDELGDKKVRIGFGEKTEQLSLETEEAVIMIRLMAGEYPGYQSIIPSGDGVRVDCEVDDLREAVSGAQVLARDNAHIVTLEVEKAGMVVTAQSAQLGQTRLEVAAEVSGSMEKSVAFNCRFLLDFLSHCQAERATLVFADPLKPGLFYEHNNSQFTHVIMPVRVKD